MSLKQFAEYGIKEIVGAGVERQVSGFAITSADEVTLPSVKGPRLEANDGAIGTLTNVKIATGATLILGEITHVTVPAAKVIYIAKLPPAESRDWAPLP